MVQLPDRLTTESFAFLSDILELVLNEAGNNKNNEDMAQLICEQKEYIEEVIYYCQQLEGEMCQEFNNFATKILNDIEQHQ